MTDIARPREACASKKRGSLKMYLVFLYMYVNSLVGGEHIFSNSVFSGDPTTHMRIHIGGILSHRCVKNLRMRIEPEQTQERGHHQPLVRIELTFL